MALSLGRVITQMPLFTSGAAAVDRAEWVELVQPVEAVKVEAGQRQHSQNRRLTSTSLLERQVVQEHQQAELVEMVGPLMFTKELPLTVLPRVEMAAQELAPERRPELARQPKTGRL
jgi:hypothetical protein